MRRTDVIKTLKIVVKRRKIGVNIAEKEKKLVW